MPTRVLAAVLTAALTVAGVSGCGESRARKDAREGLVLQLIEDGTIDQGIAECVVERFFDDRSDEELARFFEEPEATQADLDAFAELTRLCAEILAPDTTAA